MEFIIKGRNVELFDDIKQYAEKKSKSRIEKFFERIIKIEVEFSAEKNRRINKDSKVEVTVFTPGAVIRATGYGVDFFEAVDNVNSKMERQIKRYKNKMIQKSRKPSDLNFVKESTKPDDGNLKNIVKVKRFEIKPMTPEEATLQMELLGHDFYVFINAETGKTAVVYKRKDKDYGIIEPQNKA